MGNRPSQKDSYDAHLRPHGSELLEVWPGRVWVLEGSLPYPLPRNMVIYRQKNGKLLVYSAIACEERVREEILALGEIEVLVIPSAHHTMDAAVFREKLCPSAALACPRSIRSRLEDKGFRDLVSVEDFCEAYEAEGMPAGGEATLVFDLDDDKKALVFCDLLFNLTKPAPGFFNRFVASHIFGSQGPLHVTSFGRRFIVEDAPKLARWLKTTLPDAVLNENPNASIALILVAHGDPIVDQDCRRYLNLAAERLLANRNE